MSIGVHYDVDGSSRVAQVTRLLETLGDRMLARRLLMVGLIGVLGLLGAFVQVVHEHTERAKSRPPLLAAPAKAVRVPPPVVAGRTACVVSPPQRQVDRARKTPDACD
jgi:hypothetical protein